jgi:hypothetical protein
VPNSADQVRIVIDETSFDFSELESTQIDLFLSEFNDALHDLRRGGLEVWKPPLFAGTSCLNEQDLYSYLLIATDRDIMRRFFSLVDKCPEWDASYPRCDEVEVSGRTQQSAWSVCFAVTAVISGHGVACLVFPGFEHRGFLPVVSDVGRCQVFFFSSADDVMYFWRGLYELEDIPERAFFQSVDRAFPKLIFHPDLTFRRFQGSYQRLRDHVVQHLGELNDHFLEEYRTASAAGRVSDIEAYFSSRGVGGVSRESVKTHRNVRAMRLREVEFNENRVLCEWHTKLRPETDRIHFAFGDALEDKILIGIFVDHLPT